MGGSRRTCYSCLRVRTIGMWGVLGLCMFEVVMAVAGTLVVGWSVKWR